MKSKKWIFILLGLLVVLVVVALIKGKSTAGSEKVTTEKVKRRTIVETVAASGKIQPETEVIISSDVSGEIIEMPVHEGQEVKQGDLLVKINPDLVQSAVNRAEASMNTAKANLLGAKARLAQAESQFENAQATYSRNRKLHEDKVISDAEYDQAKANYEVAKSEVKAAEESVEAAKFNVKSAEATLSEAEENLGRTSIYSPMSGVITKLNREKGERVVGTAQMAGTEIMTVADLSVMEVAVEVNENDIVRVNINDTTEIEVDAYLDEKFIGVVTEIANSAKVEGVSADQVTNFDVKIRMIQSSYKHLMEDDSSQQSPFRPGMSASVDIRTKEAKEVLSVPIQAVTTRAEIDTEDTTSRAENEENAAESINQNEERKECVFVEENGKAKQVFVKTGIQNTMHIEIKEGLKEDEQIISGPYTVVSKLLKDGKAVEVVEKKELFNRSKK